MSSKEFNLLLLNQFPELTEKFKEETDWQEGIETGSIVVVEDVFMPYMEQCVKHNKTLEIERIFLFIESLCDSKDTYVQNILYVAILENIFSYNNPKQFTVFLKEKSLLIYNSNFKK